MPPQSRGRGKSDLERPIELCEDDRRKLYSLLDGDVSSRIRRIELGMVGLAVMSGSQIAALFGAPNPVTAAWHLFF